MNLTIADPADVERVVRLVNDAYRGSAKSPGWTHEAGLLAGQRIDVASVRASIANETSTILVLRTDDDIVGCVALQPLDDKAWYLSMLAVDPDRQITGMGKAIMAGAERFAQERGARQIKISVINVRTSLIEWYERMGYARTGAVEPFPDDAAVGTPLRHDLSLVTLVKQISV
jgi:N-acetylglutamate synthase-like GNAT family acetyltransferase